MSTDIKPRNESCAAVELYASYGGRIVTPFRSAYIAAELVKLGASFQRIFNGAPRGARAMGHVPRSWGPHDGSPRAA